MLHRRNVWTVPHPSAVKILYRIMFGLSAVISAALLLAVIVVWVHSYDTVELVYHLKTLDPPTVIYPELGWKNPNRARRDLEFGAASGSLSLVSNRMLSGGMYPGEMPAPDGWRRRSLPAAQASPGFPHLPRRLLGIGYDHSVSPQTLDAEETQLRVAAELPYQNLPPAYETWIVQTPCSTIAAATALLPLAWVWSVLRGRRYPKGHCSQCGYDLRASAGRCPECGAPVAQSGVKVSRR